MHWSLPNYSLTASAFPSLKPLTCTFPAHVKYLTYLYHNPDVLCYIYPFNKPVQRRNNGKWGGVVGKLGTSKMPYVVRIKKNENA